MRLESSRSGLLSAWSCVAGFAAAILLGACSTPDEPVHWSPNGERAIVSGGSDVLIVTDAGANLKKLPEFGNVFTLAWLPDSHHFAGVRVVKTRDWNVDAKVLGQKRAHAISSAAEELIPAIRKYQGLWEDFEKELAVKDWKSDHEPAGPDLATAMLCLQATHPDVVEPVLKARREQLDEAHRADEAKWEAEFTELFIGDADAEAKTERVLFQSADLISNVVCSPDGGAVAFTVLTADDGAHLKEISVEGGEAIEVDNGVMAADWTPDGTRLIYAKSDAFTKGMPSAWVAGSITQKVWDQKGKRLTELEDSEELVDLLLGGSMTRIACLPDGRVLFATPDVHSPLLKKDMPDMSTLFVFNPAVPSIDRVLNPGAQKQLPSRSDCFVVNRDGTRVAVPGENGELAVISLADGKVTQLQAQVPNFNEAEKSGPDKTKLKFLLPAWKTPNEISYAIPAGAPDGSPDRAEIVLQEIGGARRVISKGWPDEAVAGFLPKREK